MANGRAKEAHALLLDVFNNMPPTPEQIRLTGTCGERGRRHWRRVPYMSEYHIASGDLRSPLNSSSSRWPRRTSPSCSASASRRGLTSSAKPCRSAQQAHGQPWRRLNGAAGAARIALFRGPPATMIRSVSALLLLACIALAGCAARPAKPDARDPFERVNRATFKFNDALDRAVLQAGGQGLPESRAAIRRDRRLQLLRQPQLPHGDRQRPAAGQVQDRR